MSLQPKWVLLNTKLIWFHNDHFQPHSISTSPFLLGNKIIKYRLLRLFNPFPEGSSLDRISIFLFNLFLIILYKKGLKFWKDLIRCWRKKTIPLSSCLHVFLGIVKHSYSFKSYWGLLIWLDEVRHFMSLLMVNSRYYISEENADLQDWLSFLFLILLK